MEDVSYRLNKIIDGAYELASTEGKYASNSAVPFFDLIDLCHRAASILDSKFFIECDLEDIDANTKVFYLLVANWTRSFNSHFTFDIHSSEQSYATIKHLFKHEDYVSLFKTFEGLHRAIRTLMLYEIEYLGQGYDARREKFKVLYSLIEKGHLSLCHKMKPIVCIFKCMKA